MRAALYVDVILALCDAAEITLTAEWRKWFDELDLPLTAIQDMRKRAEGLRQAISRLQEAYPHLRLVTQGEPVTISSLRVGDGTAPTQEKH